MGFIDYEVDGQVGIITINRPKALNALNSEVLKDLDATIDAVDLDAIRCLIITGAGEKSFVAGADIGEMSTLTKAEGEAFGKAGNWTAGSWSWNYTWFWWNTETCSYRRTWKSKTVNLYCS